MLHSLYLRPESDGRVLAERGAKGGDLLCHLLQLCALLARVGRVVHEVKRAWSVQGEDLEGQGEMNVHEGTHWQRQLSCWGPRVTNSTIYYNQLVTILV
jgi:hypothetical protein